MADEAKVGAKAVFKSRAVMRAPCPKLLKLELGDDLTDEATVEQLILAVELLGDRCSGL